MATLAAAVAAAAAATESPPPTTPSVPKADGMEFVEALTERVLTYISETPDPTRPVIQFRSPKELHDAFYELGCPLAIGSGDPVPSDVLLKACEAVMELGVCTGSPLFNNQLYGTPDPVAIAADWLAVGMNNNSHTYEVAPVFTLIETELFQKLGALLGGEFARSADGLFVPGGSMSNIYAMQVARYHAAPETKTQGNAAAPGLCAFCSDEAHYSYAKAANLLGLGTDNLIKVATDSCGVMQPEALSLALEQAKAEGRTPFFVGTTAGTTVLGAFDPFTAVAEVCQAFNESHGASVWLHIDGAWGGSALLSRTHGALMDGACRADSFCFNPHKVIGAPLQCSMFVTRHPGLLMRANSAKAAYLFQPDKENASMDYGDKTIMCGRRVDQFKLWVQWKYRGDRGLESRVDHLCDLASYMSARLRDIRDMEGRRCFVQVVPTSWTNVVFYFIPPRLRTSDDGACGGANAPPDPDAALVERLDLSALAQVAPPLKSRMQRAGGALIGFQPVKVYPNVWRMVFAGAKERSMSAEIVDAILASMMDLGADL